MTDLSNRRNFTRRDSKIVTLFSKTELDKLIEYCSKKEVSFSEALRAAFNLAYKESAQEWRK
jgi:hypothetical protein